MDTTDGHPALEGRMMFTNGKPGTPDAAFVKMNNPTSPEISKLVSKGYLVTIPNKVRCNPVNAPKSCVVKQPF